MRTILIYLALALGLQACGLKGPLVLPTTPPATTSEKAAPPTTPKPASAQEKPAG